MRYNKVKAKAPKLTPAERERLDNPKKTKLRKQKQKPTKRKSTNFLYEDVAPKRFVTVKDRLMQEVKEKIYAVDPV